MNNLDYIEGASFVGDMFVSELQKQIDGKWR